MSEYHKDLRQYEDMLDLPHHQSKNRPHMSLYDRAAQFMPFQALSGYQKEIEKTAKAARERMEKE